MFMMSLTAPIALYAVLFVTFCSCASFPKEKLMGEPENGMFEMSEIDRDFYTR